MLEYYENIKYSEVLKFVKHSVKIFVHNDHLWPGNDMCEGLNYIYFCRT